MADLLKDLIGYDFKKQAFTVGSHDLQGNKLSASKADIADVDNFLAQLASSGSMEDHELLAQQIAEPIIQVIPYRSIYNIFFQDIQVGELEDNSIPVEDTIAIAFETHPDSEIMYTRAGFSWTRPDFTTFDTGIEVGWRQLKRAGWNFVARVMQRAMDELARKRDQLARGVLIAAIPASHEYIVTGGSLTKAGIDQFLKDQAAIGFPVSQAMVNPATLMAMGAFTWGATGFFLPNEEARQLLRTLYLMDYGGVQWYTNPFMPTNEVLFSGPASMVGWHQIRGEVNVASDVDITKGVDLHAIRDADHAYYVGNTWTLGRIRISA